MIIARQSTARTVMVGPVLDADGVAVTDGVVADVKISKNGGIPAALNASATIVHRHTGHYSLALTASDLDTVGQAEIVMDDTVNAMPPKEITVIEEAVYDALFAASAAGYGTAQTGDSFARLGAPAGASVSADVAAVKTAVDTVDNFVDTEITDIQSRLPAALTIDGNIKADALRVGGTLQTAGDLAGLIATVDTVVDATKENTDYPDGFVYLDPTNGAAGTTVGTNGTIGNPSNTFADAATIAASLGYKRIKFLNGVTLSSGTFSGYVVDANGKFFTINQVATFQSSKIFSSGPTSQISPDIGGGQNTTDLDTGVWYENLEFFQNLRATNYCYLKRCIIGNTSSALTFTISGDNTTDPVYLEDCYTTKVSGLTFSCGGGADLILSGWYGDFTITNLAAGTTVQVYGWGKVTLDASCTGGTVRYTSHIQITDNSGNVTKTLVSEPGGVSGFTTAAKAEIQQEAEDALAAYDPPTRAELTSDINSVLASLTTIDDYLDTEIAAILAAVDTEIAAIVSAIGTPSDLGNGATLAGNAVTIESQTDDIGAAGAGLSAIPQLSGVLTESYRAQRTTGTFAQLLYEISGHLGRHKNLGTERTVYKLDTLTPALVFDYDDNANPTSILEQV